MEYRYKQDNDDNNSKRISKDDMSRAHKACLILDTVKFCPGEDEQKDVKLEKITKWCNDFMKCIQGKNRAIGGSITLAQIMSKAPNDQDGAWPHKSVCEMIEKYHSDIFDREMRISVSNQRGVHSIDLGQDEGKLAAQYYKFAAMRKIHYRYTARILTDIAKCYSREAEDLRKRAGYER